MGNDQSAEPRDWLDAWMEADSLGEQFLQIWHDQALYNDRVKQLQMRTQVEWVQTYLLGLLSEAGDLLDAFSWKRHRPAYDLTAVNRQNMRTEVADLFKYVMCLAQIAGISLPELLDEAESKGKFLHFQLMGDFLTSLPTDRPVLVFDLDGTLADFRTSFAGFVAERVPSFDPQDLAFSPTIHMDIAGKLGFDAYHTLKSDWEARGGYGELPAIEGMVEAAKALQETNSMVYFTARPTGLKRVQQDTWRWLLRQDLRPDRLFLGKFERIVWAASMRGKGYDVVLVDDDPEVLERAVTSGVPIVAVQQPYNLELVESLGIPVVSLEGDAPTVQKGLYEQISRAQEAGRRAGSCTAQECGDPPSGSTSNA